MGGWSGNGEGEAWNSEGSGLGDFCACLDRIRNSVRHVLRYS